jgi:predicted P-loop ATPase
VFAASVNERGYIPDERGARRFWPVACGAVQGIDLEGVARDRDQLWAEAVVRYRAGSPFHLDSEWLRGLQRAEVAERREHHAWEDILAPWLEDLTDGEKERGVTTADALDFLKIPTDRWPSANSQVGRVLRSLGYEQAERPRETTEDGNTRRGKWRWKRKERPAGYIRRIRPRRIDPRQLELFAA